MNIVEVTWIKNLLRSFSEAASSHFQYARNFVNRKIAPITVPQFRVREFVSGTICPSGPEAERPSGSGSADTPGVSAKERSPEALAGHKGEGQWPDDGGKWEENASGRGSDSMPTEEV